MKTILIAGGSGLVGRQLTKHLIANGHHVRWLSRTNRSEEVPCYKWNVDKGYIEEGAFDDVNVIINLSGAGIADHRWTRSRKEILIQSRTKSISTLDKYISKLNLKLDAYINASAIGYYGDKGDDLCFENESPGISFLSACCLAWENAVGDMKSDCTKIIIRIGIVLSTKGGALEKILIPLKMRTNTYFGDGQQWMSWIHIDDLCAMVEYLIDSVDSVDSGISIFNAVGSYPIRNKEFVKTVAKGMGITAILLPAPTFGLRLAMGEMADVVLDSTKVSNQKIKKKGFKFQFDDLEVAIQALKIQNS